MRYAEVIVNVPIRRTFSTRQGEPPPPESPDGAGEEWRTFHYHLPPHLEETLGPGHLVWVPFGRQQVQGIVWQLADSAPVPTRPVDRLARPLPVLTPVQLTLAAWLADYYVASILEVVRLFLPPGLLTRSGRREQPRARRELQVTLAAPLEELEIRLQSLARSTPQATVLAWLLDHPGESPSPGDLAKLCGLRSDSAVRTLAGKGLVRIQAEGVFLAVPRPEAEALLATWRGLEPYRQVLAALQEARTPLWKSDLYARVSTDLKTLRALQGAGLIRLEERVRFRDPLAGRSYPPSAAPVLTGEQEAVWQQIWQRGFQASPPGKFLIHGVTGSGKTEIYLRAIEEALQQGRQAIVLVPEIALTPQTVARFAGRFPGRVTVVHSGLSVGERYDVWRAIRDGHFDIVVGPRSALFAPLPRPGLIVLDEEHEASYKQNAEEWGSDTVFYDARTVAHRLAELTQSVLILGSATPSLESYFAAQQGQMILLEMPRRVMGHRLSVAPGSAGEAVAYAALPPVEIVDMRQELRAGNRSIFSRSLEAELHATLDAGEQAILFLNRRGTSTFVMCRDCGAVQECPRCEVPLTYHERAAVLICHHCNRRYPIPERCPNCDSRRIKYFGSGTQRIEEYVSQIAPRARLLRWDADTTGHRGSHESILTRFAAHEADVLVGTQMIAKGLDLPLVTLVGVISADTGLYLPDFRSAERTFQLLTQVAGRAGRSQRGGRVVIQTYTPDHYAIQAAAQHDYASFYRRELAFRQEHGYPPVRRLARLIYWHRNLAKAQEAGQEMATILRQRLESLGPAGQAMDILGPVPAFFARHRGYYRWQILIRGADPAALLRGIPIPFGWRVDVDPVSIL